MLEIKSRHLTWVGPKSLGYKKNVVVNGRKKNFGIIWCLKDTDPK